MSIKKNFNKATLAKLAYQIKPVIEDDKNGSLHFIKSVDIKNVAFTWDATYAEKAKELKKISNIFTQHSCGYYGLFKPSIEEVLTQMPDSLLKRKPVAFSTTFHSQGDGSYHNAVTTFYTGNLPKAIKEQTVTRNGKELDRPENDFNKAANDTDEFSPALKRNLPLRKQVVFKKK